MGFAYICISEGVLAVWSHTKTTSGTDGGVLIILSFERYGVGGIISYFCHTYLSCNNRGIALGFKKN